MEYFTIKMMVLRNTMVRYVMETFTCDKENETFDDIIKKLKEDKSVISFYHIL